MVVKMYRLTKRQINLITQEVTPNKMNSIQIRNKLYLPVTSNHIAHILRKINTIKTYNEKSQSVSEYSSIRKSRNGKCLNYWKMFIFSEKRKI